MRKRTLPLLLAALLAGCAAGETAVQPDQSLPQQPSVSAAEPAADKLAEGFVDDPASPYPMVVESWSVDMDGDGVDELVQLRAEKAYFGNEVEPDKLFESANGLHPYTLLVTVEDTVYELPLGRDSNDGKLLYPQYFPLDGDYSVSFWAEGQRGQPVLILAFDNMSQGGAGGIDVYATAFQSGKPVFLPIPECGYHIEATLDEETMLAQLTVLETGYTETLDLMEWLKKREERNRENGHDITFEPIYREDGSLEWPVAPGQIDSFHQAEPAEDGLVLRQYIWGSAHMDGMGDLTTALSWIDDQPVVLNQRFEWYY